MKQRFSRHISLVPQRTKPISYAKKIEAIRRKRQGEVEAKKSRENGEKRRREKERRYGERGNEAV